MEDYVKRLKESLDRMTPEEQKALNEKILKIGEERKISVDEYLARIDYENVEL